MRSPPCVEADDPERTRVDENAPATAHDVGRHGRGSILAGKYRLEMLLGEGGMACVWSAYHLELELPVAIKLLRAGFKNEKLAARLRLEARAAAHLAHPSIVRVFDVAMTNNGDPFIVMELLAGESLAATIARERLSGARAVQLLLPIAEALAIAHAKGIIHRDLKPHNVFLAKDGKDIQPKLLDFGIAKLEHAVGRRLTDKGTVLGSPSYMSPEQVRGDDVDYRTDIWSFCVVLYKAVTGRVPFIGADTRGTMNSILLDEPAPMPADVDAELARLILWGLAKDPARRAKRISELGSQLAQWLQRQSIVKDAHAIVAPLTPKQTAPRSLTKRYRRWALLTAAAGWLVTASLAWADAAPAPSARPETTLRVAEPPSIRPVSPAVHSTIAPEPRRAAKTKAVSPAKVRPPAPRLPF